MNISVKTDKMKMSNRVFKSKNFDSLLKGILNDQTICYYHCFQDSTKWAAGATEAGFTLTDWSTKGNHLSKVNIDDDFFHLTNISGWSFDGVDDRVQKTSANILSSGNYTSIYIDFEFYEVPEESYTLFSYDDQDAPTGFYWIYITTDPAVVIQCWNGARVSKTMTEVISTGRNKILILIDTAASSNNLKAYLNGSLANQYTLAGIVKPSVSDQLTLGSYKTGSFYHNGMIREFLWHNEYLENQRNFLFYSGAGSRT